MRRIARIIISVTTLMAIVVHLIMHGLSMWANMIAKLLTDVLETLKEREEG